MARQLQRLSALTVNRLKEPGLYADGGGLYLRVKQGGGKFWCFRYMLNGNAREMGLGALHTLSLADARIRAGDCRKLLNDNIDPINARKKEKEEQRRDDESAKTFKQCAAAYLETHKDTWRNAKHRQQWENTLKTYAYPLIGDTFIRDLDREAVKKVLLQKSKKLDGKPLWSARRETASRLRGRIEKIWDWAKAEFGLTGDNPARWAGNLKPSFADHAKREIVHQPALPYDQIGDFVQKMKKQKGVAPMALIFTIMTAARTSEVIGAKWSEIDLKKEVWTIPKDRMKGNREHRVPLADPALRILKELKKQHDKLSREEPSEWVFRSSRRGKPLSNMAMLTLLKRLEINDITVHGFRSSFRDWAAEQTNYPREIAEAALAHISGDKVEASYLRTDHFEKRSRMMNAWAAYCETPSASKGKVLRMRKRG